MAEQYGNINIYLNTLVSTLLEDDTLCKFLYYNTNCDVLSQPNLTMEQKLSLLNSRIFVNKMIPVVQHDGNPLLMIRTTSIEYQDNKTISIDKIRIAFYIICNIGVVETQNGARDVCISYALDSLLLQAQDGELGIGKLKRWRIQDLADLGTEYQGYVNTYEVHDFNPIINGNPNGHN